VPCEKGSLPRTTKRSADTIAAALVGYYRPEHLFALAQALEFYEFYQQQIAACDVEIEPVHITRYMDTDREASNAGPCSNWLPINCGV
jgi:hypothetical protein